MSSWPVGSLPIGAVPDYNTPHVGDTVREAFRLELDAVIAEAWPDIEWQQRDGLNTGDEQDAATGYFELEFLGGDESQYTFGAPGFNLFLETGAVAVHAIAPMARSRATRDTAEKYLEQIRVGFRARRINMASQQIRITGTTPLGGGAIAGGMWAETIVLGYELFNTG